MKKILVISICLITIACLCSCSYSLSTQTYDVVKNETIFTVDIENGTIFDGTNTYQYILSSTASGHKIDITFPDGSTYWWKTQGNSGYGGWSDDYDETRYISGDILCNVLEEKIPKQYSAKSIFIILAFSVIGIFNIVSPRTAWYLSYGWRYKNAEPSDIALVLCRCSGIFAFVLAIIMMLNT